MHCVKKPFCCLILTIGLWLMSCQQKMADQPRYEPLQKSDLFDDQRASRPLIEGTVPSTSGRDAR